MTYDIKPGKVIHGDSLQVLRQIEPGSIDAVITDPPYSSGGLYKEDRAQDSKSKYLSSGKIESEYARHSFSGDNLDQRAWMLWCAEWLNLAIRVTKQGGVIAVFTDWRQLCALCDALQWAGWIWRGIITWDKKNSRPQPGRPRQQCEYIVWGSAGALDIKRKAKIMPGIFTFPPPMGAKRVHQTEKPLALMRCVVKLCEESGTILYPFAGSGTTLAAAAMEGYDFIGIEKDEYYFKAAEKRVKQIIRQGINTRLWEDSKAANENKY